MLRLTIATLLTQRRRFAAVVLAITLAVAFGVATRVTTDTLAQVSRDANTSTTADVDVLVRAGDTSLVDIRDIEPLRAGLVDRLRAVPGVAAADGQVVGYAQLVTASGELVDPGAAGQNLLYGWPSAAAQNPYRITTGTAPLRDDQVVLDANLASRAKVGPGDRVRLVTAAPVTDLTVAGIARFGAHAAAPDVSAVFTTTATARRLTRQPGSVDRIFLTAAAGVGQQQLAERVRPIVADAGARLVTGQQWRAEQRRIADDDVAQYRVLLTLFAVIALVLGTFVIANAFSILAAQRTQESALLRAVGATSRQVARRARYESLGCGLAGSILGVPLGVLAAVGLQRLLQALDLAGRAGAPVVAPATVVAALVAGALTAAVAGELPARRSARIAPMAAIRQAAVDTRATSPRRRRGVVVLTAAAVIAAAAGRLTGAAPLAGVGVVAGFVAVVAAGPVLSRAAGGLIARVAGRLSGAPGELAGVSARRDPRRSAAALTLAAGVAVVTVVMTVAASIHATFAGAIAEQYRGQVAVLPAGYNSGQTPGLPSDVARRVTAALGDTASVLTLSNTRLDRDADGEPARVTGVSDFTVLTRLFDLGEVTGDLTRVGPGDIAVNAGSGWRLGRDITLPLPTGARTYRVVATYTGVSDDPLFATALLPRRQLLDAVPAAADVAVHVLPRSDPAAVREQLRTALADTPIARVVDKAGYVRANEGDFRRIFAAVHALLGLAAALTLIGIANTLTLSVVERRRELAVLRAIGLTPRQLRTMLRWETFTATLLGLGLGLGLGLLATVVLIPTLAAGIRLTIPLTGVAAVLIAGLTTSLALAGPAVRQARTIAPAAA